MTEYTNRELSLKARIKVYHARASEMKKYLDVYPQEWGRFQSEFNQEINGIFRDLIMFEKDNLNRGNEERVYKLKRLFIEWFRDDFVKGEYLNRSLKKPSGYPGDYKIIDSIYQNSPCSVGFERLYDNYFQMSTICNAVRNRKEDFKQIVLDVIQKSKDFSVKIMDLASGPCRDVLEVLANLTSENKEVIFHCYDNDEKAISYARELLKSDPRVIFYKQNAVRLALKKNVKDLIEGNYDLIYSTGLFDYLDYKVSVRLVANLKKLLKKGSFLAISDVRDKFSNPSIYFMEWVADWNLIYRDDDSFRNIFIDAGFSKDNLSFQYEQQGLMQYIFAKV